MITFDVADKETFKSVRSWIESINLYAAKTAARILVGNKIDLPEDEREVTREEAKELADQFGIQYHECSAKANQGLKEMFEDIFEQSYKAKFISTQDSNDNAPRESVKVTNKKASEKKKGGCAC